ncbi:MAG: IclR family transcriptional regulator [Actinobacteria bacterium]|jgi:IclR family acetate operon transcriptional repressor|nr:IclR family transcriptional regulator [Actinomycetota bacterium]
MTCLEEPAVRHIASVERAVAVLDALAQSQSDLGTNEIARRTRINASSVSRLLATLARKGLVAQVAETGRYRLGLRLLELGNAALSRVDIRDTARPHLDELASFTGETATLSVPGEREAITMDFVESLSSVQSVARLGRPSVAHATAIGKVLLAYGGKLPESPLIAYTERTITDRRKLAEEVARTAERGWAQAVGEREVDLNALAAPIIGGQGELKGVLGVQGPAGRFGRQAMRSALKPLLSSATALSGSWTE